MSKVAERKLIKVVVSGVPSIYPNVDVYDSTLEHMAIRGHTEELQRIDEVYRTIEDPDRVHASKTNPRAVVLINETTTSASGDPLRVPVKIVSETEAIMSSAYFSESNDQGPLLWKKGGKQ